MNCKRSSTNKIHLSIKAMYTKASMVYILFEVITYLEMIYIINYEAMFVF